MRIQLSAGHPARTNAVGVAEYAAQSPEQLLELARRSITPRGLSSMFGGRIAVIDGMIHLAKRITRS